MPSSVISSYHYSAEKAILSITFISGITYRYTKIPSKIYDDFKSAFSKGIYFNEYIKDKFEFERL